MTTKTIVRPLAFAAILATLALPASAQWGPEEEKNCFLRGHKGTVTLSGQINDAQGDSSKLEQYEEIPEGVLVPCAAYSWSNDKYFFDAKTIDIGYDDQFLGGVFGKKGGFLLGLSWDQNPNWQSNTARTPYTQPSAGVFTVPDSMRLTLQNVYTPWVTPTSSNPVGIGSAPANPTVPGFYAVENFVNLGLPTFDLRYVRKTGRAGIDIPVGKNLVLNASYARELRDGNKNTTFAGGPDYEVATPIDFTTDNFHFGGDYAKGRFFLGASVDVSQFKNDVPFVEIDNPERLEMFNPTNGRAVVNDAEFFRLWMYPDNEAWQADFTGGFTLAKRHKLTASLSTGNMSMEMPLQYNISTNPNLQTSATTPTAGYTVVPPYGNIAAEYDTFMGNVKFTGDPLNWLGYMAYWRKFELDDKTEDYHFTSFARGDTTASYNAAGIAREHSGLEHRDLAGRGSRHPDRRPAARRELRAGQAQLRHPRVRRRHRRRFHPLGRLQPPAVQRAPQVGHARPQAGRLQRAGDPAHLGRRDPDRHQRAQPAHLERLRHAHAHRQVGDHVQRREDEQRVRRVGHRPARPVVRHVRRRRDLRRER